MSMLLNKGVLLILVALCVSCQVGPGQFSAPLEKMIKLEAKDSAEPGSVTPLNLPSRSTVTLLLQGGELQAAESLLRERLSRHPEDVIYQTNLGLLLAKTGRAKEAVPVLESVLLRAPNSCPAALQLAEIYVQQFSIDQAEQAYRSCLAANPNESTALLNFGILLELYRGDLNAALGYYERYQLVTSEADAAGSRWTTDLNRRVAANTTENQLAEVRP